MKRFCLCVSLLRLFKMKFIICWDWTIKVKLLCLSGQNFIELSVAFVLPAVPSPCRVFRPTHRLSNFTQMCFCQGYSRKILSFIGNEQPWLYDRICLGNLICGILLTKKIPCWLANWEGQTFTKPFVVFHPPYHCVWFPSIVSQQPE